MKPTDDPNWGHYASTVLEILADRSLVVDLASPIPMAVSARLYEDFGVGPSFAVITASNPRGQGLSEEENAQLASLLLAEIEARGLAAVPADGVSPDRRHREAGLAIAFPTKEEARRVATTFGQSGFYWYDGSSMWLIGALAEVADVRLPASSDSRGSGLR